MNSLNVIYNEHLKTFTETVKQLFLKTIYKVLYRTFEKNNVQGTCMTAKQESLTSSVQDSNFLVQTVLTNIPNLV